MPMNPTGQQRPASLAVRRRVIGGVIQNDGSEGGRTTDRLSFSGSVAILAKSGVACHITCHGKEQFDCSKCASLPRPYETCGAAIGTALGSRHAGSRVC